MDSVETKQRIKYLIEHGGLWEQARDDNIRTHRVILLGIALVIVLQFAEFALEHLLR